VPSSSDVSSLIPLIYDAAEDTAVWPDVLNQIGGRLKAVGKVVAIDDLSKGKNSMALAVGIDPAYQRIYAEHYESVNIHMQRARSLLAPGRVLTSNQLCSDEEILTTAYYHEFLRPQDGWFHVMGGCVAKDQSLLSVVSFMRGRRAGHFSDREIKLLETLMPHLQRAARLHHVFGRYQNVAACLELLPNAALFVTEHGHVKFANQAARTILQRNDGLGIDGQGCLSSSNRKLPELVTSACRAAGGCGTASGGSLLIGRNSGNRPYAVSVSPIRGANLFSTDQRPGAIVFVKDPETRPEPMAEALRRLYGMTPAEARLATLLAGGKDLSEACAEMSIRRTTARTHLRRLSEKVGAKRQAEVVSVILRTVGPTF